MSDQRKKTALAPAFLLVAARMFNGIRVPLSPTAFIHCAGFLSLMDDESRDTSWPLVSAKSCDELWRLAEKHGIGSTARPLPGELFVLWSAAERAFAHAGIVAASESHRWRPDGTKYYPCVTYEANTSPNGSIGGGGVNRVVRDISPDRGDRFIRWVDLDGYRVTEQTPPEAIRCVERMSAARAA